MNNTHTCSAETPQEFRFIGGAWQPIVENFEQLKAVLELDEAWFAITGIDITSLRADQKFLAYLDSDKNGKIRTVIGTDAHSVKVTADFAASAAFARKFGLKICNDEVAEELALKLESR